MDPSYLHYNHRYAPFSPRPNHHHHDHPNHFPQNPNLYGSHHLAPPSQPPQQWVPQPLPQPLPQQPQPPPQSHRPFPVHQLPHQHPYDPHNILYNSHPIDRNNHHPRSQPSSSHLQFHDLPHSSRVSHRAIVHHRAPEFDRETRPNLPSRVIPENRPHMHHPVVNMDHHHQFEERAVSQDRPIDRFRHGLEGNSRVREELNDHGFGNNLREDFARGGRVEENSHRRGQFVSDSDRSSRDVGVTMRGFESNSGHYDNCYGSGLEREVIRSNARDVVSENQRWGNDRQILRDTRDSAIEMGNFEIGDGVRARIFTRKVDYHALKAERYNDKGSREGIHEFSRTPWKQVQKKSALLRIQMAKPNHRSREDERSHYSSGFGDNKSSSFRGKDPLAYSAGEVEEKEREGSPMELDVSFKSNSLVAKAIVAPSSSSVVSGTSLTPSKRKIRKVMVSGKDCKISQSTTLNESTVKLDSSIHVVNMASSSDKDLKQSIEKVKASGVDNKRDSSSKPSSGGTNVSIGKTELKKSPKGTVSNKGGTNAGPSKLPLRKVGKKKKVVKRVVKKVIKRPSQLPGSQSTESFGHWVPAASGLDKVATPLVEKVPSAGISSVCVVDSQHCANEVTVLPENDKEDGSPKDMASTGAGGEACLRKIKRKRNSLTSPLGSSDQGEEEINKAVVCADDSVTELYTMSNKEEDRNQSLNVTTISNISDVEDASKQFCEKGDSLILENGALKEPLDVLFPVGGNFNSGLLSSEEKNIHDDLVTASNIINGMNTTLRFDYGLCNSQEKNIVSEIGSVDLVCANQASPSIESGIAEGSPKAISLEGSSGFFSSSSSAETRVNFVPTYADCCNHGRGTDSGPDSGFISSEKINDEAHDDTGRQPYTNEVTTSPENGATKGSPNTIVSIGCEEDMSNICTKREVLTYQLDLSSSITTDRCNGSVNVDSSAHGADTTLSLSMKNSSPAEVTDTGMGCLDVDLQPCIDGVIFSHGSSLTGGYSETKVSVNNAVNVGPSGTSPEMEERVKVPNCYHGLSSPTASMINNTSSNHISQEEKVILSNVDTSSPSGLPPCPEGITVVVGSSSAGGSSEAVGSGRDAFTGGGSEVDHSRVHSCSVSEDLAIPSAFSFCASSLGCEQIGNATPVMAGNNCKIEVKDMETDKGEKLDVDAVEEQVMVYGENAQCRFSSEHQTPGLNQRLPSTNVEYDAPSVSKYLALVVHGDGVPRSSDELMQCAPNISSDMGSPKKLPISAGTQTLNGKTSHGMQTLHSKTSHGQVSDEKLSEDEKILDAKSASGSGSNLATSTSVLQYIKINSISDHAREDHLVTGKAGMSPAIDSKDTTQTLNSMSGQTQGKKNHLNHAVPNSYPGRSSFVFNTAKHTASSTHITKPRTWHRTGIASASPIAGNKPFSNTVSPQGQWPKKAPEFQSSYIRKGNSLLRKPAPGAALPRGSHGLSSSVYRLNSSGIDEVKNMGSDSRVDAIDPPNFMKSGVNAPFERPRTPPLPSITKVRNRATSCSGDYTSSPLAEPLANGLCETATDPIRFNETDTPNSYGDGLKVSETPPNQTGSVNNLECRNELNDVNLASTNVKRITYVKRKSNQLVATSNVRSADKTQAFPFDGYYKRRKNQLIRTSADSHIKQTVSSPDDALNTEGQTALKIMSSRSYMRRSHKVVTKPLKHSKFSLVWTPHGNQLSNSYGGSLHRQKVLPQLFPWKRATWRSFMQNTTSISRNSSLSTISRKLLLLRKRDTIYTRSIHGFSLRKSKVLSVGGSNLKWSKSIERDSKKANEEATLAVAAVEKKKREQHSTESGVSGTKNRSHSSRERIFRIGSVRYKMDSSRRTLQRISDDESASAAALLSENDAKKSYVPRRLVIGNDEYVRIGNGNQLIRDPKKRSRVLASEKVRWSLHTARLRLARKRKYCQFFTRFGKCNKDDGKCPYIHDPSKVAVCTKFLSGLCSNPNCKLTHKVIPERMPDCSYFVQGLCTNKSCPYRHVHVNPNASSCEGFLRGYCVDGNECRKKHSYVCPIFEATGSCPEGSKCKLHHPKKRSKGRKRRRSCVQKNARGRYFGSLHTNVSGPGAVVFESHLSQDTDDANFEEKCVDYISLDVSNEDAGESNDPTSEQTTFGDSDPSDLQSDDLDELIKPIRIMNKNL